MTAARQASKHTLQGLRPRLPGREIPAGEEHTEIALVQDAGDRLNLVTVAPMITQESVVSTAWSGKTTAPAHGCGRISNPIEQFMLGMAWGEFGHPLSLMWLLMVSIMAVKLQGRVASCSSGLPSDRASRYPTPRAGYCFQK